MGRINKVSNANRPLNPSCSSTEDLIGIIILLTAFPFLAVDLVRTGGWRGCALSAAWCVTYDDPVDRSDGLPAGSSIARLVALGSTALALMCRLQSLRRHSQCLSLLCYKANSRIKWAIGCLLLSNLAMFSCAVIPMSCGCLRDGVDWVYVDWRDYVHDGSLWTIYVSSIISGFCAKGNPVLLYLTVLFAVLQSIGIFRCPTSANLERVALLLMEVVAIALTQFLHYGAITRLFRIIKGGNSKDQDDYVDPTETLL
mmetsp:Transcript_30376/g.46361  ORF Transcript_30376/g.46361 Transcript_30376/m.46361 type:complete len:256 (+) Transcript_30376:139-906(+)